MAETKIVSGLATGYCGECGKNVPQTHLCEGKPKNRTEGEILTDRIAALESQLREREAERDASLKALREYKTESEIHVSDLLARLKAVVEQRTASPALNAEGLKECPFCGSHAAMHNDPRCFGGRVDGYRVECEGECHGMTCWWHTREEAISRWNSRPPVASPVTGETNMNTTLGGPRMSSTADSIPSTSITVMAAPAHPDSDSDELMAWLQDQIADTIYLDDGQIIDIRGGNVMNAIRAARKAMAAASIGKSESEETKS